MNTIAYDAIQHSVTIHGAPAWISFTFASPEEDEPRMADKLDAAGIR